MTQPTIEEPLRGTRTTTRRTRPCPPSLPPQLSPKPSSGRGGGRRREAWSEYRRSTVGMVGLVILVLFIAMAVFAPLLVPESELDVTRATGTRSRRRAPSSRWGPTRAAVRCWP